MRTAAVTLVMMLTASTAGAVVVDFTDPGLEAAVRSEIGIPSAPINDYDLVDTGFTQLFAPFAGMVRIGVGTRSSDNGRRWGFVSRSWAHMN